MNVRRTREEKKNHHHHRGSVKTRSISSFWDMCGANQGRYIFFLFQSILVLSRFFFMFFFVCCYLIFLVFLLHCLVFMLLVSRPLSLTPLKFISLSLIVILISFHFLASFIDLNYGDGLMRYGGTTVVYHFQLKKFLWKMRFCFRLPKKKKREHHDEKYQKAEQRCAFFMCIKIFLLMIAGEPTHIPKSRWKTKEKMKEPFCRKCQLIVWSRNLSSKRRRRMKQHVRGKRPLKYSRMLTSQICL